MKKLFRWLKVQLAWLISRRVGEAVNDPDMSYEEVKRIAEEVADRW